MGGSTSRATRPLLARCMLSEACAHAAIRANPPLVAAIESFALVLISPRQSSLLLCALRPLRSVTVAVYRTTLPIGATAEAVWAILVDFERWPEWNPSVPSIRGDVRVGSTVNLTLAMPGRPSAKVKARLTEVAPERRLCWHGNVGGDRVFAGTREFGIDPQPDGAVLFTHVENITGLLFPVFRAVMGPAIQHHHDNLNAALKQRAERPAR